MSTHELDRIADIFAAEQRKVDYELDLALARVEMLRKMKENLSRQHMKAQADYLMRARGEVYGNDEQTNQA
jgi:hypothetical protein